LRPRRQRKPKSLNFAKSEEKLEPWEPFRDTKGIVTSFIRQEDALVTVPALLASVHRLFADERRRRATDKDLLQAFVRQREERAFAELLRRHGPMVLRLALHLLRHRQDAEDVIQAAFLTLARKAHSLRMASVAGAIATITSA
jgi:hypothetical protein